MQAVLEKVPENTTVETVWYDCVSLIRCRSPEISAALVPWFIPKEQTGLEIGVELAGRLEKNPEDTYVGIAIKPDAVAQAVLIAYCRDDDVFIWQAQAKPKFQHSKEMFGELIRWAKDKGYKKLCCEVYKKPKVFMRKYKFHLAGQRKVNDYVLSKLIRDI